MALLGVQAAVDELLVVLLDVAHVGRLQQVVACVHLHTDGVQRLHHLGDVGDDGFGLVGQLGQEVVLDDGVDAEFHLLGVDEHKLQLGGVLLVEQRGDDGVQTHGLTLTGSTSHEHVGHLGQIHHEHLVRDGLTQGDGQLIGRFLELLAADDALPRHDFGVRVGHLDTDGTLARYGRYDTDAQCREAQGDVVLQSAYFRDAHALFGSNLVERHRRSYGRLDGADFDAETAQCAHDLVLVGILLVHVDGRFGVVVVLHQVQRGEVVVLQVEAGVVRFQLRALILLFFVRLHLKFRIVRMWGRCGLQRHGRFRLGSLYRHLYFTPTVAGRSRTQGAAQVERNLLRRLCLRLFFGLGFLFGLLFYDRLRLFGHGRCRRRSRTFLAFCRPRGRKLFRHFAFRLLLSVFLLFQEVQGKDTSQPHHRPCAEVDQEADGRHQQQQPHARRSHLRSQPAADVVAMHTAQVDERIFIQAGEGKAEEHREPHQQQRAADEPSPQADVAHLHQLQACSGEKHQDEERRNAEAVVDQVAGQLRAARSGIVLHAVVHGHQVLSVTRVEDALVRRPRKEERRERQQQVDGEDDEHQPHDEAQGFVVPGRRHLAEEGRRSRCIFFVRFVFFFFHCLFNNCLFVRVFFFWQYKNTEK